MIPVSSTGNEALIAMKAQDGAPSAGSAQPKSKRMRRILIAIAILVLLLADLFGPLRVKEVRVELAAEELFRIGGLRVTNSLLSAWIVMAVLILLALLARRRLVDTPKPYSLQNIFETAFEMLSNFMQGSVGDKARAFFPFVATLFIYILFLNWFGLLPGVGSIGFWSNEGSERVFRPLLRAATSDMSTTLALAICAVIGMQAYGIRFLGVTGYGSRFLAIDKFVEYFRATFRGQKASAKLLLRGFLDVFIGVLDIFEEFTKIFSFAFRLFGNVFAGEVLLLVLAFLVPYLASLPFMLLELFVGLIQAFIFATLTTAFLGKATTGHASHVPASEPTLALPEGANPNQ
jgi:F-type H+-transporting ATPase subunit a